MSDLPVLVTGSRGLIGSTVTILFARAGIPAIGVDLKGDGPVPCIDIRDTATLAPLSDHIASSAPIRA